MKILIVDDEVIVAEDLGLQLRQQGHTVTGIAASADEAVSLAASKPPDVVLMDIRLRGETNGVEAAAMIQQQARAAVPIVFISAYDRRQFEGLDQILNSVYLNKPVEVQELLRAIHGVTTPTGGPNGH